MTRPVTRYLRGQGLALVALFVALGGTSYAATGFPANVIGAKQLKRNAVTNSKVANRAVTGGKVARNSITGAQVRESSLGQVPSAAHADNVTSATTATNAVTASNARNATNATSAVNAVNTVDAITATTTAGTARLAGAPPATYQRRVTGQCDSGELWEGIGSLGGPACTSSVRAFSVDIENGAYGYPQGPLSLVFFCSTGGAATFSVANVGESAATLNWFYGDGANVYASGTSLGVTDPPSRQVFDFDDKRIEGQFIFASGSQVVTVSLHVADGNAAGCDVRLTTKQASSA